MNDIQRLFDIPEYQLAHYPLEKCLVQKENGKWVGISTQEYINKANMMSEALLKLGIQRGDKIGMISNNRTEWNIVDLAILQIGAINVPIYPTISQQDYKYIFNDAGIKYCFISSEDILTKAANIKHEVPSLIDIFTFDKIANAKHWTQLLNTANGEKTDEINTIKASIKSSDLATLIYTSGTTGNPKGVMLSHENLVSNVKGSYPRLPVEPGGKSLSFLPICHVYERMLLYLYTYTGVSIHFAESLETIGDNLKEVQPDVFTAVPRLLEKIYDKIIAKGEALTGIKRALFFWSLSVAEDYKEKDNSDFYMIKLWISRKLIFSKWKEAVGGRVKAIASGSASLQTRLARVFNAAEIPIMEGYGLTETSPVISVNEIKNDGMRFGSVGKPIDFMDVRIEEDGEIVVKGPNVMLGYYNLPEKTKETFTDDGYFRTGDIGEFRNDFLYITDRKKEMFKTSGGKYIAPQVIENKYKESRFIEQIMVVGENQKLPAALIVPSFTFLKNYCLIKDIKYNSIDDIIQNERIINRIAKEIDLYNQKFGKWEQVKKFELLNHEWTVENGELTATLKLKRRIIKDKYQKEIDKIYC